MLELFSRLSRGDTLTPINKNISIWFGFDKILHLSLTHFQKTTTKELLEINLPTAKKRSHL